MTTTQASLSQVRAIIDEYLVQEFHEIFLRPLSPYGFALRTKSFAAYDTQRWLEFYREGIEYVIDLNRKGIPFMEHYAALILKKMLTSDDPGYVDLMSPAGIGIGAVLYNYDGDVYASDESRMLAEMVDKSFRIGNVNSRRDISKREAPCSPRRVFRPERPDVFRMRLRAVLRGRPRLSSRPVRRLSGA